MLKADGQSWPGITRNAGAKQEGEVRGSTGCASGSERIQYVEAFQISEYGRRPIHEELQALFPIR